MPIVRAKFKLNKTESSLIQMPEPKVDGQPQGYSMKEQRSLIFNPVYSNDPASENKKFWDSSPTGELRLGTVNPAAWEAFELGKDYYLDFTPADAA